MVILPTDHHMISIRNSQMAAFSDIFNLFPSPSSSLSLFLSPPTPCDVSVYKYEHTSAMARMWKSEVNLRRWSCLPSYLRLGLLLFNLSLYQASWMMSHQGCSVSISHPSTAVLGLQMHTGTHDFP